MLCDDKFIWRIFRESPYTKPTDDACIYIKNKIGFDIPRIKKVIEERMKNLEYYQNKIEELKLVDVQAFQLVHNKGHQILMISGGFNGRGTWNYYIKQIEQLINLFPNSYIINLTNDVLDDVWYLQLGIPYDED